MSSIYRIDFRLDPPSATDGEESQDSPWLRVYTDDELLGLMFPDGATIPPRVFQREQFQVKNTQVDSKGIVRTFVDDMERWRVARGQTTLEDLHPVQNDLTEDATLRFLLLVGETTKHNVEKITERLRAARFLERGEHVVQG